MKGFHITHEREYDAEKSEYFDVLYTVYNYWMMLYQDPGADSAADLPSEKI